MRKPNKVTIILCAGDFRLVEKAMRANGIGECTVFFPGSNIPESELIKNRVFIMVGGSVKDRQFLVKKVKPRLEKQNPPVPSSALFLRKKYTQKEADDNIKIQLGEKVETKKRKQR